MKKVFILLNSIALASLNAQTLTQAIHEPVAGDMSNIRQMDTSAFSTGLPLSSTGANQVWNFSAAHPVNSQTLTNIYGAPSAYTQSPSYPGTTVVQDLPGGNYTFFKSVSTPTAQAEIVGIERPSIAMSFTNSAIVIQYPAALGFSLTDNVAGSYSIGAINGPVNGQTETYADGSGTLILGPGVTFTNVLRVRCVQNLTLTQGTLTGTLKQTVYNFYDQSQKYAIVNISYIEMAMAGGSPSVTAGMFVNANNYATVGLKDNGAIAEAFEVYPNPASQSISIRSDVSVKSIALFDITGKKVLEQEKTGAIDITSLSEGIYVMKLESSAGIATRKIVVSR